MGYVDTPMAAHSRDPKLNPAGLVDAVYDALEEGQYEVFADQTSRQVRAGLSGPLEAIYPKLSRTAR